MRVAEHCARCGEPAAEALQRLRARVAPQARRHVLRAAAGLGLASTLPLPLREAPGAGRAGVDVVGAGFAGLQAATLLAGKSLGPEAHRLRLGGVIWPNYDTAEPPALREPMPRMLSKSKLMAFRKCAGRVCLEAYRPELRGHVWAGQLLIHPPAQEGIESAPELWLGEMDGDDLPGAAAVRSVIHRHHRSETHHETASQASPKRPLLNARLWPVPACSDRPVSGGSTRPTTPVLGVP